MDSKLQEIISSSTYDLQDGRYIYIKAKSVQNWEDHFMVSKDNDEITVVTREENLAKLDTIEKNKDYYRLIALNVTVPFYSVGFLAAVSSTIAKEGMNVLIISTYSKDYIMVRFDLLDNAIKVLQNLGFKSL